MTRAAHVRCRVAALLLAGALTGFSPGTAAAADQGSLADPAALLARIGVAAPATTRFVEVHFSPLLVTPVVVSGELEYRSKDLLRKRIERPYREQMEVNEDRVSIARDGEPARSYSLKRVPALRGILVAFGSLLAGDYAAIEQSFAIVATQDGDAWQLLLTPREDAIHRRLRDVVVAGSANTARCITVNEADGATSVTLLGAVAGTALPEPLELERLERLCSNREHPDG